VTRGAWARLIALASMTLVTGWSLWAWAQQPTAAHAHPAVHAEAAGAKGAPGHADGAGEGGEADESPKPMNWTEFGGETPPFIAMLINFGILAGGYYWLGKKPVGAALQHRRDTIAKEIDEAQRMKREAEARAKTYQDKLAKLEEEVTAAREAIIRAGENERERIVREAEGKAERMRKDAEFMVQQEIKQIRVDLWRDTVEAAVAAAEQLLTQRVTPADHERLAENYLADLAASKDRPVVGGGAS
jgi:F0F1-type ATP synthase membrane subunit b/b'